MKKEEKLEIIKQMADNYLAGKGKLNPVYDYNFSAQMMEKREKSDEV